MIYNACIVQANEPFTQYTIHIYTTDIIPFHIYILINYILLVTIHNYHTTKYIIYLYILYIVNFFSIIITKASYQTKQNPIKHMNHTSYL